MPMNERIIPDWDRLALKIISPPETVAINGTVIVIPDEAKERPQQAYVVGIGPNCTWIKAEDHPEATTHSPEMIEVRGEFYKPGTLIPKYRVGDKVFVGRFSGTEVTPNFYDKETWVRIIKESEILARVFD